MALLLERGSQVPARLFWVEDTFVYCMVLRARRGTGFHSRRVKVVPPHLSWDWPDPGSFSLVGEAPEMGLTGMRKGSCRKDTGEKRKKIYWKGHGLRQNG